MNIDTPPVIAARKDATFEQIGAALHEAESFVVVSHLRPDGDALGCQLAMGLALLGAGKKVKLWNEDGMVEKLAFLPHSELVTTPPAVSEDFDVLVALDTATYLRLGTPLRAIGKVKRIINIDHHVSNNGYGDIARIDASAPATGQILYELFASQGLPVTREIATNLFAAISTDTGSFQYPQTSARTYEIGAALIRAGVDIGALSQQLYESHPLRRLELLRALLNTMKLTAEHRVASFALSLHIAKSIGAQPDDNEGLIDYIRGIDTVQVAAFFEELPEGLVRISLRSKTPAVNVSAICSSFGGGGHILASGARMRGSLDEVEARVLARIQEEVVKANLPIQIPAAAGTNN